MQLNTAQKHLATSMIEAKWNALPLEPCFDCQGGNLLSTKMVRMLRVLVSWCIMPHIDFSPMFWVAMLLALVRT